MGNKIITPINLFKTSEKIITYNALWDTGATESLISSKVVSDLMLIKYGEVEISSIDGIKKVNRYICNILLNDHSKSISLSPAEFSFRKECDMIIGMDIIKHGLFVLNRGIFTFSIDMLK